MHYRSTRMNRALLLAAQMLVLVLVVVIPRTLLAPATATYNRTMESKRPKSPKNILRVDAVRVPAAERQTRLPGQPRTDLALSNPQPVAVRIVPGSRGESREKIRFLQPDYLRLHEASLPQSQSSPPA